MSIVGNVSKPGLDVWPSASTFSRDRSDLADTIPWGPSPILQLLMQIGSGETWKKISTGSLPAFLLGLTTWDPVKAGGRYQRKNICSRQQVLR